MTPEPVSTREIANLPHRATSAHKGDVGRILVVGGSDEEVCMIGAPALTANAALRSGAGLVQIVVPESLRAAAATLAPCCTVRSLPKSSDQILSIAHDFRADVLAIGPGLGEGLTGEQVAAITRRFEGIVVLDADALNRLAELGSDDRFQVERVILTPHPGELARLLEARGLPPNVGDTNEARREAALALSSSWGVTAVVKGSGTAVTDGRRFYVNETGNAGMATAGAGDVLTGIIAALAGQKLPAIEACILGTYLHGLAGDFAAEELGRWSITATDLIDYLPEAFVEHRLAGEE